MTSSMHSTRGQAAQPPWVAHKQSPLATGASNLKDPGQGLYTSVQDTAASQEPDPKLG